MVFAMQSGFLLHYTIAVLTENTRFGINSLVSVGKELAGEESCHAR